MMPTPYSNLRHVSHTDIFLRSPEVSNFLKRDSHPTITNAPRHVKTLRTNIAATQGTAGKFYLACPKIRELFLTFMGYSIKKPPIF